MTLPPPVRFSRLSKMGRSPAHYRWSLDHDEETSALRLGRALHSYLLGGEGVIIYEGRRAGKVWEAFEAAHPNETILIPSEAAKARGMRYSIERHPLAMELLDGRREEKLMWKIVDRECQSTPDVHVGWRVVELKSTKCSDPRRFVRDAIFRGYHAQLSFYGHALRYHGFDPRVFSIVAVESTPPHPVTIYELTARALEQGEKLWRGWYERLLVCGASDSWPGYCESVVEFDAEDNGETVIQIDGEDVEL